MKAPDSSPASLTGELAPLGRVSGKTHHGTLFRKYLLLILSLVSLAVLA